MNELERLAGNVIVCGFANTSVPSEVMQWINNESVAGLILFKRNIEGPEQTSRLIASAREQSHSDLPLLMCIDQEGGRVARLGAPVVELPSMRTLGQAADSSLSKMAGRILGRQLRAIGINLDFAPVLDVDTNPENPVIGDRAFGTTPDVVIEHALSFADGLHEGGVLSCGKHFPGHGDTDLDSHHALPYLRHDRARLESIELAPFRAAVGRLPSIMTAHVVFESLDEVPATLSRRVIRGLLREEIGYRGAVFTDDLEMKAVSANTPIEESGVRAIDAGCDILLVCSDIEAAARLRSALARKAEADPAFLQRLTEARERANTLRQKAAALPAPVPWQNALDDPDVRVLEERLLRFD